jgi:CPA2 family monovalent cation:H+ antiporter-2
VLAAVFGYSPGTGAFVIGLSIRGKRSKFLESRVATIKDLFIVLFFISMGSLIDPVPALSLGIPLLAVLALVILGKFAGRLRGLPRLRASREQEQLPVRIVACP